MNIYYDPEKFGLTVVAELHDPNADYSFDTTVAWKHEDGRVLIGSDAGCSCPTPFEDVHNLSDLLEVNRGSWPQVLERTEKRMQYRYSEDTEDRTFYDAADISEFLRKVAQAAGLA